MNCSIPHCENLTSNRGGFDHNSVKCWTCKHTYCECCTKQIWTGTWNGETFYKPKFVLQGLRHEVFKCPMCRASFDRLMVEEE